MRIKDRLELSLRNLSRRKSRTILTILSVVIGATSIILMLAFSQGINRQQEDLLDSFGSLTSIDILTERSGGSTKINEATINKLKSVKGVKVVMPSKSFFQEIYTKDDEAYSIQAPIEVVPDYVIDELTADMFESGSKILPNDDDKIILGPGVQVSRMINQGDYFMSEPVEDFDYTNHNYILRLGYKDDMNDDGVNFGNENLEDPSLDSSKPPYVDIDIAIAGRLNSNSFINSWTIITNESLYKRLLEEDKKISMPSLSFEMDEMGNPIEKKGDSIQYDNLRVVIDDPERLEEINKAIIDKGFQTRTDLGMADEIKQTNLIITLIFGGIGSVAFIVSAIGIINTMLMSIYERQKEIGVMKVIGASIKDIRSMFLIESGFIGFFGGLIGLIISLLVGLVINGIFASSGLFGPGGPSEIIVIPLWLALVGVGFSALVGVLAGYIPARRATKLSAIEVLRAN
ncbi:MAG: ABC transporter permease [Anaerococcus sp.]|nr:ABC transporter permease [Anaerococcus sp.]